MKRVQKGWAGHRLGLHPEPFVRTEIPVSCPQTGECSNGKQGAAETLCCCRQLLLGRESPLRCVALGKRQPVASMCFCRVSPPSPLLLSTNRKIGVGQQLDKVLMLVWESPQEQQGRDLSGAPAWPGTTILSKGTLQIELDWQDLGWGVPDCSQTMSFFCAGAPVQICWSVHTREPLHHFKVGYEAEISISLSAASYSSLKKSSASVLNQSSKNSEILAQQFQSQTVVGFHITCTLKIPIIVNTWVVRQKQCSICF